MMHQTDKEHEEQEKACSTINEVQRSEKSGIKISRKGFEYFMVLIIAWNNLTDT